MDSPSFPWNLLPPDSCLKTARKIGVNPKPAKKKPTPKRSTTESDVYEVERIDGHEFKAGKMRYFIEWKDYYDSCLEPEENIFCKELLLHYKVNQRLLSEMGGVKVVGKKIEGNKKVFCYLQDCDGGKPICVPEEKVTNRELIIAFDKLIEEEEYDYYTQILDYKFAGKEIMFLVEWFPKMNNQRSWIPKRNFCDPTDATKFTQAHRKPFREKIDPAEVKRMEESVAKRKSETEPEPEPEPKRQAP